MLFGEHAVLRGKTAIAAAIDCPLRVQIQPHERHDIVLSSHLGDVTTSIHQLQFGNTFRFVESCFSLYKDRLPCGAVVTISSSINPTVGLGSSAAVTVALLAALSVWVQGFYTQEQLLSDSCRVIRAVQGHGSGADAASIIWGGVIAYRADPAEVIPLQPSLDCVLISSGKKTPTADVIRFVNEKERLFPATFRALFAAIEEATKEAQAAIATANHRRCGELMNISSGFMEAMGVSTEQLSSLCWRLRQEPTMYGAKISGSGLGDAVVGLGKIPDGLFADKRLASKISPHGVVWER